LVFGLATVPFAKQTEKLVMRQLKPLPVCVIFSFPFAWLTVMFFSPVVAMTKEYLGKRFDYSMNFNCLLYMPRKVNI
jgi:hypothetical protein